MIKNIFKRMIFKYYNITFISLIKIVRPNLKIMPHKFIDEFYEIFENINKNKIFMKKIFLPYENIEILNRINIFRPYEILEIKEIGVNSLYSLKTDKTKDMILPIAILDIKGIKKDNAHILLSYNNKEVKLELKYKNRFHYLPIKNSKIIEKIEIKSDTNQIVIGKPFYQDKPLLDEKPKLIVQIFIDAVTQSIIDKFGYDIMPNTRKFFSNGGTFYTNAYAQSEWTLSSLAGIFTGKYTNEHLMYHPRREDKIQDTTLADVLSNEGYLTFACTNVPKLMPINGYDKGFDRFILAADKDCNYIINEAIEQLDTFKGNQYLFVGCFDVHESYHLLPISAQVNTDIDDFVFRKIKGNSKDTTPLYDNERIHMYKAAITYIDKKLQSLYQRIEEYDENAIVILHSDHGVNFMTKTEELLGKEREKVVFFYKNNKEHKIDDKIKEIRELPSMICNDLNIINNFDYKYNGYVITESLYPNKDYEIAVRDEKNVLFFKVVWQDILNKTIDNYKFHTSYHLLDDETIILKKDENYKKLVSIAQRHYLKMIKTIQNRGL